MPEPISGSPSRVATSSSPQVDRAPTAPSPTPPAPAAPNPTPLSPAAQWLVAHYGRPEPATFGMQTTPLKHVLDVACAVSSDRGVLELARRYVMERGGVAEQQLTHFLSSKGTPQSLPLAQMLAKDVLMRLAVSNHVGAEIDSQLAQGKRGTEVNGFIFIA